MRGMPRHLYLHVPFCRSRCAYCAFYSTTGADAALLDRYVNAVLVELSRSEMIGPWDTIYLGGGTPSLLAPVRTARLLDEIRTLCTFSPNAEVTIEANPEGLAEGDAAALRAAGVNRLSLGVQSFDDDDLRLLARPHDAATARRAVAEALRAGLRVSLDLIYGLPGRSPEHWARQLDAAAATGVEHVSAYELSLEPGTRLADALPDGLGDRADLFFQTHEYLATLGFEGYEVSNFARGLDARSRHNLATWAHRPYLGLGPAAHSFLDSASGPLRRWNLPDLEAWLVALERGDKPPRGDEVLTADQRLLERVMLGLRTLDGVDLDKCRQELGDRAADGVLKRAAGAVQAGVVVVESGRLRPTLRGMALADGLAAELAP